MAQIIDLYKQSEFAKLADKSKDKTPISDDQNNIDISDKALQDARGGIVNTKKYSETITFS